MNIGCAKGCFSPGILRTRLEDSRRSRRADLTFACAVKPRDIEKNTDLESLFQEPLEQSRVRAKPALFSSGKNSGILPAECG
jgi:hypothetical protein